VDLGRVDFIDSTGLGVLVGALNRARELGGNLQLICAQERVLKLLRITGLDQVFTVRSTLEEALAADAEAERTALSARINELQRRVDALLSETESRMAPTFRQG